MSFDPELFGQAMGEEINRSLAPLHARINELEQKWQRLPEHCELAQMITDAVAKAVSAIPLSKNGKDCDMDAVKAMIEEAVKAVPVIHGKDGQNGRDGKDGEKGERGEKGADGVGASGAMIDRDGALVLTMTNGEAKNLGVVVGKDGKDGLNGKDGVDGLSLESFDLEYLDESHEIRIKASAAGRVKEVRFPAGGIRPGGYWSEGTKAQAGEAWVHGGSTYFAKHPTTSKPDAKSEDWIIAARRGRDGERGQKGADGSPPAPIKLRG